MSEPRSWQWKMEGIAWRSRPGAMTRPAEESGVILAEGAGGVLDWLVDQGPWDSFDQEHGVTVTVEPDQKVCGFCKGKPVGNAATWLDDKPRLPAPCPRCGETNLRVCPACGNEQWREPHNCTDGPPITELG